MLKFKSLVVLLAMAGGCASQSEKDQETMPTQTQTTDQGYQGAQGGTAQPTTQPPQSTPTLPTSIPPITAQQTQQFTGEDTEIADQGQGQWVYTEQYGWIWMPYSDDYIYTPDASTGGSPYAYVYYPTYGWTWLDAPWVWGFGVQPFFVSGGFHHRFFREHERFRGGEFRGERFRGGFHQPPGFRTPVSSRAHGHPMAMRGQAMRGPTPGATHGPTGGHVSGGHMGGGHMGGGHMGGGHMGGGGGHMGGGGGHGGGGGGGHR